MFHPSIYNYAAGLLLVLLIFRLNSQWFKRRFTSAHRVSNQRHVSIASPIAEEKSKTTALTLDSPSDKHVKLNLEWIPDAAVVIDPKSNSILTCNSAARQLLSIKNRNLESLAPQDFIAENGNDVQRLARLTASMRKHFAFEADVLCRSCSGATFWAQLFHKPIEWNGQCCSLISFRDISQAISERKQLEDEVSWLRLIADATHDGIVIHENGKILYANNHFEELSGRQQVDIIGQNVLDLLTPTSTERAKENIAHAYDASYQVTLVRPGNVEVPTNVTVRNGVYEGRRVRIACFKGHTKCHGQSLVHDFVDSPFQAVLSSAPLAVWATDLNGTVTYASGNGLSAMNIAPADIMGRSVFEIFPTNFAIHGIAREALSGKVSQTEIEIAGHLWFITIALQRDEHGNPSELVGMSMDITDRRKVMEERVKYDVQLKHSQRLETVGTLAGGIAHDFNNILTPILGYAEMALMDLPQGTPTRNDILQIVESAHRAKDLVKQILVFSRQSDGQRQIVQLPSIIRDAQRLLRASIPTTIELRSNFDRYCGNVQADPSQMHQVVMNLIVNAYHAIGDEKGSIEVCTRNVHIGVEDASRLELHHDGAYVCLEVRDSGSGMSAETIKRIFEPFFTTKEVGKGTGLGLAVVHGIVKSHGGGLEVHSEVNKGTTFAIYLPVSYGSAEKKVRDANTLKGGGERILIVDDDANVLEVYEKALRRNGYSVTSKKHSLEALVMFRYYPDSFDLLITDLTMPVMCGDELAEQIIHLRPDLPIIMITGHQAFLEPERMRRLGVKALLSKPFTQQDLLVEVARVLNYSDAESISTKLNRGIETQNL